MSYYDLYQLSETPGWPDEQWFEERKKSCCCECLQAIEKPGPIDVYLAYPPDKAAINFVTVVGHGYAHVALLEVIGAEGVPNLSLGKVFDARGRCLEEYATFRADDLLFIRGKQTEGEYGSKLRRCSTCGRLLYFPRGSRYIIATDLTGSPVYETQLHSLLVDEDAYRRLKEKKWKKLGIWKLPVKDAEPADRCILAKTTQGT